MKLLVLYALLSTALWYLGSRAKITSSIWSRYPPRFASFMDCSACTGFWWGATLSIAFPASTFMDVTIDAWLMPIVVGLCMIAVVPIFAGIMQWGLWQAGSAIGVDDDDEEANH